ncbi:MAG: GGDEF domain-containing protein [Methylococcaceae bacterium]|jgi:diguanylate cyclase
MKKPTLLHEDGDWKAKFLNLSDRHSKAVENLEDKQELLCKTIVKLTFAISDFDPEIDQHMVMLREHLKNGIQDQQIKSELNELTNTLARINNTNNKPKALDTSLLFDFLLRQYADTPQEQSLLQLIQASEQTPYYDSSSLFINLLNILHEEAPINLALTDPNKPQIDADSIKKLLLQLMDGIDVPELFLDQALSLKQQLLDPKSTIPLEAMLDRFVTLVLKIKQHVQKEQLEIDKFLSNLTIRLNDLGSAITGTSSAVMQASIERNKLDQSVSEQMKALQEDSILATKLEPLQEIINIKLSQIAQEIADNNQYETKQRNKSQEQLDALTVKIKQMESESAELKSKLQIAETQAMKDALTGLPNRLAYEEQLDLAFSHWQRTGSSFSLIIFDVDHFKAINDRFGHKAGDKALIIIAKQLAHNCRKSDFLGRIGGEEFVMLLADTEKTQALKLADQLRLIVEKTRFNANGSAINITISCGIAEFTTNDNFDTVFERADQALYQAKQQGRNQCCIN